MCGAYSGNRHECGADECRCTSGTIVCRHPLTVAECTTAARRFLLEVRGHDTLPIAVVAALHELADALDVLNARRRA